MKKKTEKPATFTMKQIVEEKDTEESSKNQYRANIDKFKRFLEENSIPDTWANMNLKIRLPNTSNILIQDGKEDKDGKKASTMKNIMRRDTSLPILRKASKRLDIPFKWDESNLESFELSEGQVQQGACT